MHLQHGISKIIGNIQRNIDGYKTTTHNLVSETLRNNCDATTAMKHYFSLLVVVYQYKI